MKIGIFYAGKENGSTAKVAKSLQTGLVGHEVSLYNVAQCGLEEVEQSEMLVLGTAAWGIGEMHTDWERFIDTLVESGLEGKKVALFGLGDQKRYPESFVDGMGTIFCRLPHKENVIGYTSVQGYSFYYSTAEKEGKFVGLAIDDDTQAELTGTRVNLWAKQLLEELNG